MTTAPSKSNSKPSGAKTSAERARAQRGFYTSESGTSSYGQFKYEFECDAKGTFIRTWGYHANGERYLRKGKAP